MVARDVMTKDVITIGPAATTRQLSKLLIRHRISGVAVVDRKGEILGVVSETDVVEKKGKQVSSILSMPALTVKEDTPVEELARLMTVRKVKRLLVVRGAKLVGIVSRADIVRAIALGQHVSLYTPTYDL
jgi:tRNA nucleotidyltransferase (CCA-adding enzyme)